MESILTENELDLINKEFKILKSKGYQEKWIINYDELNIIKPYFEKGDNGYIYNCNWRGLNIVVKTINKCNYKLLIDFIKEVNLLRTIKHPNIVQFLGLSFNESNNNIYILMEKIHGETLKKKLNKLNKKTKYNIIKKLINTINFLHKCNPPIIFRDLKPDNIMIDENNDLKLIDFGLARYMPESDNFKMTGNTGNYRYMCPEVFLNKNYNLKADIYSLGLIIYYIITDEPPFFDYSLKNLKDYFHNDKSFNLYLISNKKIRLILKNCLEKNDEFRCDINYLIDNINNFNYKFSCLCF